MDKRKPVAIILPCHNSGVHLAPAIESIRDNTEYPFKLIIVESESTDDTNKVCDKFAEENDNIEVYHTKKEGITKALNFGIEKAGDLDVYLTQDDVILPNLYKKDWLTLMVKTKKVEKMGAVTTIRGGGTSGPSYVDGMEWAGTWSLFIPRKTLNRIGNFDEGFSPGPGDDLDFSYRIKLAGLRIYVLDYWVDHHRMTENFYDDMEFIKMKNGGYFRKKHNLIPSWSAFDLYGDMILLDDRSIDKDFYGCFKENKQIDDPETIIEIMKITKKFKKDDITLDVGAHIGLMSLAVQNGKVKAFESTPGTYDVLKNNAVINEWKSIEPINAAVYSKVICYHVECAKLKGKPWTGMNRIVEDNKSPMMTITVDSLMDKIKNVKLIKVDTETCDLEVLKGASKILDRDKPILITEHVRLDNEYLKSKGYKMIKRVGPINLLWRNE